MYFWCRLFLKPPILGGKTVARSFPQSVRLKKIQKQSAAAKKLDGGMRLGACAQRLKAHRGTWCPHRLWCMGLDINVSSLSLLSLSYLLHAHNDPKQLYTSVFEAHETSEKISNLTFFSHLFFASVLLSFIIDEVSKVTS
jgi:hypothetical protein